MLLSRLQFDHVMRLSTLDLSTVPVASQMRIVERCQALVAQLPQITSIEGVTRTAGAKYLFEKALFTILESLGEPVSETTQVDLAVSAFLSE